ncbi:ribonuclease Z [archaeon]|nr:ribonuclease Z [archaeon]
MRAEIVFLGTSSAVPTKDRNHSAVFLRYGKDRFLFDCGEGAQRQMMLAGKSPMKIGHIFFTHNHGDHVLGLPGLLQSTDFQEKMEPMYIYGPKTIKTYLKLVRQIEGCDVRFKTPYIEAKGIVLETENYTVEAFPLKHSTVTVGYVFEEKTRKHLDEKKLNGLGIKPGPLCKDLKAGKSVKHNGKTLKPEEFVTEEKGIKVVYATDTMPLDTTIEHAKNADVLIHDATFASDAAGLAKESQHSTAKQAAEIARDANVKLLVLTHYSARYKDSQLDKLRQDAQKVFENVLIARDFERIEL